jgi:hypothetical protein
LGFAELLEKHDEGDFLRAVAEIWRRMAGAIAVGPPRKRGIRAKTLPSEGDTRRPFGRSPHARTPLKGGIHR